MFKDRAYTLTRQAAEVARERVRADRRRGSERLRSILVYVEEHLLDPEFRVGAMRRELGLEKDALHQLFREELARSPWGYVCDRRMEIAAHLLATTDLEIWRIGTAVGCASGSAFTKAFKRWSGQTPKSYRQQAADKAAEKAAEKAADPPADAAPAARETPAAAEPAPAPADAAPPVRVLGARRARPSVLVPEILEQALARALWEEIHDLSYEELVAAIETRGAFDSPALYDLLLAKSQAALESDAELAMVYAAFTLVSLDAIHRPDPDLYANLRARLFMWISTLYLESENVCYAQAACRGALEAFKDGALPEPAVMIELGVLSATFYLMHGKRREATTILDGIQEMVEIERALAARRAGNRS